jgi:hypothetical protein
MTFNPDPTPEIPYAYIKTVVYDWYSGAGFGNIHTGGGRDGTLTVTSRGDEEPFTSSISYLEHSNFHPLGSERWTLLLDSDVWTIRNITDTGIYNYPIAAEFVNLYRANPEYGSFYFSASKVYRETLLFPLTKATGQTKLLKPQIRDYFTGYSLDSQPYKINLDLILSPPKDGNIKIHFYYLEQEVQQDCDGINHPTVSIQTWMLEFNKLKPYHLQLTCVPCSISLEGDLQLCSAIKNQIKTSHSRCFPEDLPLVKSQWESLYELRRNELMGTPKILATIELELKSYVWAASPRWGQQGIADLNTGQGIGENVADSFVYDKYFKAQLDETFGKYIMPDSALVKLIGASLNVDKYGVNELDNTKPRFSNLGRLIESSANLLGYSPDANGKIDVELQKKELTTQSVDIRKPLDTKNYSPYGFSHKGMAIAHLPNDYDGSKPINGGGSLVMNLPNLILELHSQNNKSEGIQDGSNIVFSVGDKKVHYTNKTALLIDLARTVAMMSQLLNTVYTNSLQTESEVREIIGALGLGTTDDSVGVNINGQDVNIPYKGVDRKESIVNELADIKLTLAVIMGKLI